MTIANKVAHAGPIAFSQSRDGDGTVRLAVSGELDIYTAPRLREPIEDILADPDTTRLMVDFAHLDYIDCTGISVLISGRRLAQRLGARFGVVNLRGQVLRVFNVLSLEHVLAPDAQACS
ncbi:STAS domain-containing protein [Planosporangium thailandense]|uniref:Anti-sigma factor antagonist n=1 Tax=Planosporangium thailandense TaxID=765197 RepID=A0ABX0Y691_9ACTN|nr:STAS domain-containing protein [Planosporangium thailandense]NJC73919.1 STAS domain-containing protein [Planosporangium thailandense]